MAKKSLGQHFLKNKTAIRAIVAALDPQPGETIFEIGPGRGELTLALPIVDSTLRIFVVEKDEELAKGLELKINDVGKSNVTVICDDALTALPQLVNDPRSAIRDYKIVGNIPYYITGHLLRTIGELPNDKKPTRCVFTIQREVARRIAASDEGMNRLAASVAYWAEAKIVMSLAPEDFTPAPSVTSAVIVLDRKKQPALPDQNLYYRAVRTIFSQPRKTIINNLFQKKEVGDEERGTSARNDKEKIAEALQNIGILPESRPQDLSVENIAKIAEVFF